MINTNKKFILCFLIARRSRPVANKYKNIDYSFRVKFESKHV